MKHAEAFFDYARKRHQITLDRAAGKPRPWTDDPILDKFRFTCVFRELDKTTAWYRENVRSKYDGKPEVLLATVVFRMLNRIEVGEAVFRDDDLLGGHSAFDRFLETGKTKVLKDAIHRRLGKKGPFVTGAYIISSPPGMSKLDGMMEVIGGFYKGKSIWPIEAESFDYNIWWHEAAELMEANPGSEFTRLQDAFEWLSQHDYFGKFHSYEIVTDLRHTYLLRDATDIMTWANPGPGCRRGMNRVMGRGLSDRTPVAQLLAEMAELLRMASDVRIWPRKWQKWEMRDVEHTLCEFDKYERVRTGAGRPRGVYR